MAEPERAAPPELVSRRQVVADALARPQLRALALIFGGFKVAEMGAWIAIVPRTATVVAMSPLGLLRIESLPFLVAVTDQSPEDALALP